MKRIHALTLTSPDGKLCRKIEVLRPSGSKLIDLIMQVICGGVQ
tara:strand:- start:475 stop:606 length:132 start_codon:yes stop_codon:yes gene_type:complete